MRRGIKEFWVLFSSFFLLQKKNNSLSFYTNKDTWINCEVLQNYTVVKYLSKFALLLHKLHKEELCKMLLDIFKGLRSRRESCFSLVLKCFLILF